MRMYKYRTIAEYTKETGEYNLGKILVLNESDIDKMLENGVFRLDGRQVWYGGDVKVFPQVPIEFPDNANIIKIPKVELKDNKRKLNK